MDTDDENRNKNVKTKPFILALFNHSMEESKNGNVINKGVSEEAFSTNPKPDENNLRNKKK